MIEDAAQRIGVLQPQADIGRAESQVSCEMTPPGAAHSRAQGPHDLWPQHAGTPLLEQRRQAEYDRPTTLPLSVGRKILRYARTHLVGAIKRIELAVELDGVPEIKSGAMVRPIRVTRS
jgi:hypothetical protein